VRQRPRLIIAAIATLGWAAPAGAATQVAQVKAKVVKPLTISWVQDLDLGTIVLGTGTWSGATVGISRGGVFSCSNPNLTCSGPTKAAKYHVTGSNGEVGNISAPNVTMTNQSNPAQTLTLVVDSPGSVTFTNSGNPGKDFSLGGAIAVSSTTPAGTYSGTFNVTIDY